MLKTLGNMEMLSSCGLKMLQQQLEFRSLALVILSQLADTTVSCAGAEFKNNGAKMKQKEIKSLKKDDHFCFLIK